MSASKLADGAGHAAQDGPDFTVGGTLYPTMHELDDCNGVDGATGTEVLIIDATGAVTTLPVLLDEFQIRSPFMTRLAAPIST